MTATAPLAPAGLSSPSALAVTVSSATADAMAVVRTQIAEDALQAQNLEKMLAEMESMLH